MKYAPCGPRCFTFLHGTLFGPRVAYFRCIFNCDVYRFLGMLAGLAARALPFLAKSILPALGIGALTGVANAGVSKALGNGLYLKKGGNTMRVETDGKGLYLSPASGAGLKKYGDGLYLSQDSGIVEGSGILLGPNSPLKNVPILGWLL